jgi:ATP adenylyltransferase
MQGRSVMAKFDLKAAIARAEAHALAAGSLLPLVTEQRTIEDAGLVFSVEWLSTLAMKDLAGKVPRAGDRSSTNPFLPFEQDLFVADLSDSHVAILNKFQSFAGHLVMITRTFVEQGAPLTRADLEACALMLAQSPGLVFFNSGSAAGASQRHRHLQFIPDYRSPLASAIQAPRTPWTAARSPVLPFAHRLYGIAAGAFDDLPAATGRLLGAVEDAYATLGPGEGDDLAAYNLLITRDWLMVVPRRAEMAAGVSLSALGFAGLIGLRSPDQFDAVQAFGPMAMLVEAAGPAAGPDQ